MPSAEQDLKNIIEYVFNQSVQNAEVLYRKILDKIATLHTFPERGQIVKEINDPLIRELKVYRLRIIYRIRGTLIQVITIHHSSRLLPNNPHFEDLFQ